MIQKLDMSPYFVLANYKTLHLVLDFSLPKYKSLQGKEKKEKKNTHTHPYSYSPTIVDPQIFQRRPWTHTHTHRYSPPKREQS